MEVLIAFLNSLSRPDQVAFAAACGTSIGYLRKAAYRAQRIGADLCIRIERESKMRVRCEDLRPDVDWAYLRGTGPVQVAEVAA
ncbi:MAG: helix-turn-helix domain-containing protein [Rhodocyclaceae bacterium]|nr:helix-turn-helix domain-containing protein [Rhodocyclaceae bacterium]